jgi:amino acid adenylation domain-containing protein
MTSPAFTPSGTFVPFGRDDIEQSIASRFEQQVRRHPDRLAVRTAQDTWTYEVLNRQANRIAHAILERDRSGRTPIALLLEQGAPLIAAILAVFKAGKILVGLDPAHPPARLAGFVEEAQPTSMVTSGPHIETARLLTGASTGVVDVDRLAPELPEANPGVASAPDDVAMILYTSGSTGRPKGVLGDHRSWIHNARNYTNAFQVSAEDRLTLLSMGTSQAMKNLLLALLSGASIFPFDVRRHGLTDLIGLMRGESISVTVMGASLFRAFVDALTPSDTFPALRLIRLGSEPVLARDVELFRRHFAPPCVLVNGLASGETQTVRFFCVDHGTEVPDSLVPVGYPVEDKTVLLVDDAGHEVEPGQVGEIVVRSPYLAPGYWRRPDLTEGAFRPAATPGGPRLYHTGDLGRMDANGCLTCLGRKNSRVKIRGHGVDLLEVEMALRALDGVKDAVVVARQNVSGYHHLVAYVVPAALPGPSNASLREALGRTLPDFMVPSTFVALGALPRTTAGKIDREALPAPGRPYRDPTRPLAPPRTAVEATIADIWREVMGQDTIDIHEHFYDLGGESLQALRIMARVRKTFGVDLDLQSLLDAPTVAEMAHTVAALGAKTPPGPSPTAGATVRGATLPLAPVQAVVWRHCQRAGAGAYVLEYAYDLIGQLDIEALTRSLSEIVRRHEILRTAYAVVDGMPVQVVGPAEPAQLVVVDASPSPGQRTAGEAPVPELELAQGRVIRAALTRLGPTEHRLSFSVHHLAMDARSRDILVAELSALYGAFSRGASSPLPELSIQYGDYAIWHHRRLAPQGGIHRDQLAYWSRRLAKPSKPLVLPFRLRNPRAARPEEGLESLPRVAELGRYVEALARTERVTPFMTLVAALAALLHHATGRRDVILGTYASLRAWPDLDSLIGLFVNLIVLRIGVDPARTFRELLAGTRTATLEAFQHADLPFETVRDAIGRGSEVPTIDIIVGHVPRPASLTLPGLDVTAVPKLLRRFPWGLTVVLEEEGGLTAAFDPSRYPPEGVRWLLTELESVLERATADPALRVENLAPRSERPW